MLRKLLIIICTCAGLSANGQARLSGGLSSSNYNSTSNYSPSFSIPSSTTSGGYNNYQPTGERSTTSAASENSHYNNSAPLAETNGPAGYSGGSYGYNSNYTPSYSAFPNGTGRAPVRHSHHRCHHDSMRLQPPLPCDIFYSLYAFSFHFFFPGCYNGNPVFRAYYQEAYLNEYYGEPSPVSLPYPGFGYVVRNNDTTFGNVFLQGNDAFLELAGRPGYGHYFSFKDEQVSCVAVFRYAPLVLVRIAGEKKLWRVVHSGKLSLYDDRHIDLTYDNIDKAHLRVSFGGGQQNINSFLTISTRRQLTECVNKAYGAHLNYKELTWNELLHYINQQD